MRILFVRSICPNPILYGSDMRSGRFVDFLSRMGDVDLLTLTRPTEKADNDYINRTFKNFFHFDQRFETSRLTAFEKLTALLPWQLTEHYSKDIQVKINKILEDNQYDLIFVFKLNPVLYFLRAPLQWRKRVVVDFDDMLSELYLRHYKNVITAQKNSFSLWRYECLAIKYFNRVFVCSKDAMSKIHNKYRKKIGIIPNVFSTDKNKFLDIPVEKDSLLFVGSLDYFPNQEGLKWFFDLIWPVVRQQYPHLKLAVVGKSNESNDFLYNYFGKPDNVTIAVNVPSVYPYYKNCFATITPLLNGSGTRLKILESIAYGRPVLTTKIGMEGLDLHENEDLFVFKDQHSFIKVYEALINDSVYKKMTADAFKVVEENYSLKTFESCMKENWETIGKNNENIN